MAGFFILIILPLSRLLCCKKILTHTHIRIILRSAHSGGGPKRCRVQVIRQPGLGAALPSRNARVNSSPARPDFPWNHMIAHDCRPDPYPRLPPTRHGLPQACRLSVPPCVARLMSISMAALLQSLGYLMTVHSYRIQEL